MNAHQRYDGKREPVVLDHLNEIPWGRLHHAYGTAEDVPRLIRALARPDQQEQALYGLFGNIWHQGTVYEASAYAVPFLFELATDRSISGRDRILGLIGALAEGESYLEVHASPGLKSSEFWRKRAGFEERLAKEEEAVRRTRAAVLDNRHLIRDLLNDTTPMVRAGAAHILTRFREHVSEFAPLIRGAAKREHDPLALAAMLWCLGAIGDASPDAAAMLINALRTSSDPRQALAAAVALYRIKGDHDPLALPMYRQMAAVPWFADAFLVGVPWDFSAEVDLEDLVRTIEPDPDGATQTLLIVLAKAGANSCVHSSVLHDLLELNFPKGNWRACAQPTEIQKEVLRRIVETDAAWNDAKRLWFLVPDGAKRISSLRPPEIQGIREEMRSVLRST